MPPFLAVSPVIVDVTALCGCIIALIGAGVALRRHIAAPICRAIVSQIREVVGDDLQAIRHELTLNGGNSVKDEIVGLKVQLQCLSDEVLKQRDASLRTRSTDKEKR